MTDAESHKERAFKLAVTGIILLIVAASGNIIVQEQKAAIAKCEANNNWTPCNVTGTSGPHALSHFEEDRKSFFVANLIPIVVAVVIIIVLRARGVLPLSS